MNKDVIDIGIDLKTENANDLYKEVKKRYNLEIDKSNKSLLSHYKDSNGTFHLTFNAVVISSQEHERLNKIEDKLNMLVKATYDAMTAVN